jgi:quinol monooxygenase YgiN
MTALSVHAYVVVKPELLDYVRQVCRAIVDDVTQEDGCIDYHLMRGAEDDRVVGWFERWRDEAAFEQHRVGMAATSLGYALKGCLLEDMVIRKYYDIE